MAELAEIKQKIQTLKTKLAEEREGIQKIEDLLLKQIERKPGLWEYGFNELEAEIWHRFSILEENADCTTREEHFASQKITGPIVRRLKNLFRSLSAPFSRSIIAKDRQFNLDKQNLVNKEYIPFHLAMVLSLQKIKDRLNDLEDKILKLRQDQEDWLHGSGSFPSDVDKKGKGE